MRTFDFTLELPNGDVVTERVAADAWSVAFTEACLNAEENHSLGPWAGIRCKDYTTTSSSASSSAPAATRVKVDNSGLLRMVSWETFSAAS